MVREIKHKSVFTLAKQSAKEIGYRTVGAYAFMGMLIVIIVVTFVLVQNRQSIVQNASYDPVTHTFLETFDGAPTTPQPLTNLASTDLDIAVQSRDSNTWDTLETIESHHGPDCSPPIDTNGNLVTHHNNGNYDNAVFKCKDHIMTSIQAGGYGVIYLSPNAMVDFTNGEAVIKVDVSTLRTSGRDWWDIWVTPYSENLQLPFNMGDVDLQGEPKDAVHISSDGNANGNGTGFHPNIVKNFTDTNDFKAFSSDYNWWTGYESFMKTSPTKRTTFELHISKTHLKFGIPAGQIDEAGNPINGGNAFWWIDKDITPLDWSTGVVQFGHHSYNPQKDCTPDPSMKSCYPDTWHWDNMTISPAIPFSIIKADKRKVSSDGETVTFNQPAPANANLRFSGIGKIQVSFDGGATYQIIPRAQSSGVAGITNYHAEHLSSYWTPIPQGVQSAKFKFSTDDWYQGPFQAKDFTIWSLDLSTQNIPSSPTPTTVAAATSTPTPVVNTIPTPTHTPTPTPTRTPTPSLTPTPTPTKIPTPTPTQPVNVTPTPIPMTPTPTPSGGIPGLTALYYNNKGFTGFAMSRIDPQINFVWGNGSPSPSMGKDTFSVVWTGVVDIPTTGTYTFYTKSDDGVRLWVDNNVVISNWKDHGVTENRGTRVLTQGRHAIQVQYYENKGYSQIQLFWSAPTITKQILGAPYLFAQ